MLVIMPKMLTMVLYGPLVFLHMQDTCILVCSEVSVKASESENWDPMPHSWRRTQCFIDMQVSLDFQNKDFIKEAGLVIMLLVCIWKVLYLNLGKGTSYPD
jgi:hypothetical protein